MNDRTETSLQSALAGLYAGPLADFIRVRDALAKELRSAGNRDAASSVKGLRKPSRTAWALNRVVHEQPEALSALEVAVADLVDAHVGHGDVRAAIATLRGAIRDYATLATEESRGAGSKLDVGDLSNSLLGVLGDPGSYDDLRSGRLTDIPAVGGLDFLTSLPARPMIEVSSSEPPSAPAVDSAEAAAAREQARLAADAVETARVAAEAAATALSEAESDVSAALAKVRVAESELRAAEQRREFARRTKESASGELRNAEAASQAAERRLTTPA